MLCIVYIQNEDAIKKESKEEGRTKHKFKKKIICPKE